MNILPRRPPSPSNFVARPLQNRPSLDLSRKKSGECRRGNPSPPAPEVIVEPSNPPPPPQGRRPDRCNLSAHFAPPTRSGICKQQVFRQPIRRLPIQKSAAIRVEDSPCRPSSHATSVAQPLRNRPSLDPLRRKSSACRWEKSSPPDAKSGPRITKSAGTRCGFGGASAKYFRSICSSTRAAISKLPPFLPPV